jgi:hypothetical protein
MDLGFRLLLTAGVVEGKLLMILAVILVLLNYYFGFDRVSTGCYFFGLGGDYLRVQG